MTKIKPTSSHILLTTGDKLALEVGANPWHDKKYSIVDFPSFLNGSYFIQLPFKIRRGAEIKISTTGRAEVYVITQNGIWGGGYAKTLKTPWKLKDGYVITSSNALDNVFTGTFSDEALIMLPATTTSSTVMLIVAKPICQGNLNTFF